LGEPLLVSDEDGWTFSEFSPEGFDDRLVLVRLSLGFGLDLLLDLLPDSPSSAAITR
jgi:hypothetical protein